MTTTAAISRDGTWKKGTFVMVKGLQSEAGAKLNGVFGMTIGKPTTGADDSTTRRYPVFLFAKRRDDNNKSALSDGVGGGGTDDDAVVMEPILVDAQAKKIKVENLIKIREDYTATDSSNIWGLFRESALNHIQAAQEANHITTQHAYLAEQCYQKTTPDTKANDGEKDENVDVDTGLLLAFCLAMKPNPKPKDNHRVVELLEPLVAPVLAGHATHRFPHRKLACHVSSLLAHSAKWKDDPQHHFQQALECALVVCGRSKDANSSINSLNNNSQVEEDDTAELQKQTALGALRGVSHSASEFLSNFHSEDVHPGVAKVLKQAFETVLTIDPTLCSNESFIAQMCRVYYHHIKDYVKAAQWYRKALDTLTPEAANRITGLPYTIEHWTAKLVLAQLQIEGMPLHGLRLMHPMTDVGGQPIRSSSLEGRQPPRVWRCLDTAGMFPGPNGSFVMASTSPPLDYTVPTTDPNDPNVFPAWLLEMVQPKGLDIDENN